MLVLNYFIFFLCHPCVGFEVVCFISSLKFLCRGLSLLLLLDFSCSLFVSRHLGCGNAVRNSRGPSVTWFICINSHYTVEIFRSGNTNVEVGNKFSKMCSLGRGAGSAAFCKLGIWEVELGIPISNKTKQQPAFQSWKLHALCLLRASESRETNLPVNEEVLEKDRATGVRAAVQRDFSVRKGFTLWLGLFVSASVERSVHLEHVSRVKLCI